MTRCTSIMTVAILLGLTVFAKAVTVSFSDSTFDDSDWALTVYAIDKPGGFSGAGGMSTASQELSGGNPGQYRRIINTAPPGIVVGIHILTSAVYDPSTQGAIISIDHSEDSILLVGFNEGQATGIALEQGGVHYLSNSPRLLSNQTTWTTQSVFSLTSQNFQLYTFLDPTVRPDFSATGAPITFGFYRGNSGGPYTTEGGMSRTAWKRPQPVRPNWATLGVRKNGQNRLAKRL